MLEECIEPFYAAGVVTVADLVQIDHCGDLALGQCAHLFLFFVHDNLLGLDLTVNQFLLLESCQSSSLQFLCAASKVKIFANFALFKGDFEIIIY